MIRLALYIVISLAVAAVAAYVVSLPGTVTIDVAGSRMQPGLGIAVVTLVVVLALAILIWSLARRLIGAPAALRRRAARRKREQGVEMLGDAFIALEAGDAPKARQLAHDAQSRLPDNVAAQLLEARAELAMGDTAAAREHYRALIDDPRTALAALSGLYEQARQQGREAAALTFARKAHAIDPSLDWAGTAVIEHLTARAAWAEALEMVAESPAAGREEKEAQKRRRAVLHTALARDAEPHDPMTALDHALSALRLKHDFVPAAIIAARIYADRGDARKAASLLRRVWRATAHPDIATLYANVQPGASAVDRLKRVREIVPVPPESLAGAVVLARAAIDAYEWPLARNALAGAAAAEPSQAVCMLMAEIEEGQNGDQGKAREWLARAVRAPRDPAWTADGVTAEEWEPVSPVTGRLDAFEWKVPVSAVAGRTNGNGAPPPSGTPATAPETVPAMIEDKG